MNFFLSLFRGEVCVSLFFLTCIFSPVLAILLFVLFFFFFCRSTTVMPPKPAAVAAAAASKKMVAPGLVTFRSLTFLGTSSGTPTTTRNVSSYALTLSDGAVWLFDAGEGTQHQLLKCANVSRGSIEKIFVTHLHGDHSFGLPGLMCSTSLGWSAPGVVPATAAAGGGEEEEEDGGDDAGPRQTYDHFSRKSQYLELIGPYGLAASLRAALISSESRFPFQYRVTELMPPAAGAGVMLPSAACSRFAALMDSMRHPDEAEPLVVMPASDSRPHYIVPVPDTPLLVRAAGLDHRAFCVGYVVTEPDTPGALLMNNVAALRIPKGPLLSKLKAGESVSFEDGGSVVHVAPGQVLGQPSRGRTAVLLGDTCDSGHIASMVQGTPVEWVVHESTFSMARQELAVPRGHSTTAMAGAFAASIKARHLILTHFSARYPSSEKDPAAMEELRLEGQQAAGADTTVCIADDFKVFDLDRKKPPPSLAAGGGEKNA